jgi:hypothetical protein
MVRNLVDDPLRHPINFSVESAWRVERRSMGWFRALVAELKARRAGRRHVPNEITRPTRDIIGITGWAMSSSWERLDSDRAAYMRSFDPRVPPSLHISARDRTRHNIPIPLVERGVEDWGKPDNSESETARWTVPAEPSRGTGLRVSGNRKRR